MIVYNVMNFNIYKEGDVYVVHNTRKRFEDGHAHIHNLDTAKYIVKLSIYKRIPHNLSLYLLKCLLRISTDHRYIRKIQNLIDVKDQKRKTKYFNVNKGINRRRK